MLKLLLYIAIISSLIFNTLNAKELEKVSVQLHWKYQFEFAGFIAAKEKGFYKDVGLDVELKEYDFGMDVEGEILNKKSTYGIYNSNILKSYLQKKPIKLISSFFKRSALVIITKPNIKTAKDLIGKSIMSSTKEDFDFNLKYIFDAEQVDTNDLKLIPHTYNVQDFIDGKCDAMTAFISDQPYKLDKLGVEYNMINPTDYGMYNLQLELFTTSDEIKEHPNRTELFRKASIKGWNYALKNSSEIIDIIRKKYAPHLSKDFLTNEAKITKRLILADIYPIGSFDKNFLQRQLEIFKYDYAINNDTNLDGFIFDIKQEQLTENLTSKEKQWIKNNTFTYAGDPNWLPFEACNNKGEYVGIVSEHLDIIEKKLNIKFNKIITKNWMDTLELSKKIGADIISGDASDVVLAKNYKPIDTYLRNPLVMVAREDQLFISDLNVIKDKKIAFVDGAGFGADIEKKYPNIKFIKLHSPQEALIGVKSGEYDIYIGTLALIDYMIIQMGIENIKIVGDTGITMNLTLYVNKNKPLLHSIINKTMNSITDIKKHEVISKWRHYKAEKIIVDYTLVWQIIILFLIIILIGISFVIILRAKVKKAVEENRKKDQMLIQQSKLAQMGEMLSMIAHQWRQPLSAINSISTSLEIKATLDKLDKEKIIQSAKKISQYSQHLSGTINDFRDFFKSKKEKMDTTYDTLVQEALTIIRVSIENKNIKLVENLNSTLVHNTYPNELKQVILNLIKNAEDILLDNNIENPVITIVSDGNTLTVSDNGGGISEDIIDKIFDPYFSTKLEKNGTGLGLYMSKTIIEEHCGGKLTVSNHGDGAVFQIVI